MTIEIELAGHHRAVMVRKEGDGWLVTIDGRAMRVAAAEGGGRWSLLVGPPDASSAGGVVPWRSCEVAFEAEPGGGCIVHVDAEPVRLRLLDSPTSGRMRVLKSAASAGGSTVVAPMPGRIVKVLVKAGDRVEPRQRLVVIEAMKMENELRAPHAGTVAVVHAVEGALVEAKAVLVALAP